METFRRADMATDPRPCHGAPAYARRWANTHRPPGALSGTVQNPPPSCVPDDAPSWVDQDFEEIAFE